MHFLKDLRFGFRSLVGSPARFEGLAASGFQQTNAADDNNLPEVYPTALLSANSFRLIGQKPVVGRDFRREDEIAGAPPVAILTYGLWERRYGKDPAAVGRTVHMNGAVTTIIGVMPPDFAFPGHVDLWVPLTPTPDFEKREAHNLIRAFDLAVTPMGKPRWIGTLFAMFAGIVLLLASVGLYAVIASSVNQRTQEIGVRMAMGASAHNILRLVFAQGMRQVASGLVIGLTGALALTRVLKLVLVEVSPSDPGTFFVASAALAAAAFGCFVPARRAMTVEPVVALSHE